MALIEAESGICECGHLLAETTAPENEFAYDASITKCHACLAGARRVAAHQEDGGKTEGLKIRIFRKES